MRQCPESAPKGGVAFGGFFWGVFSVMGSTWRFFLDPQLFQTH